MYEKNPDGQISGKIFLASHGCRGDDGFVYFFQIGIQPLPPKQPQRPHLGPTEQPDDEELA